MSQNYLDLYDILDEVFASKTLEEWRPRLNAGDFPWSPIQNFIEVTKDPQARANDFFLPLKMPSGETMEVVANPLKFNRIPDRVITPAPEVGQHTDEILIEYGYNAEDIAKFREEGVIG
jgi:crotonobetainyl-CoA:carnitine CoA-transferase CaiB-like acyl-CoA transferase